MVDFNKNQETEQMDDAAPNRIYDKIHSSVFSAVLFILLISFAISPEFSFSTVSNNFRWRNDLVEMYNSYRFKSGDRVYNETVVGKDGWIFYTGNMSMSKYQKVDPFSKKELSGLQKKLDRLNNDLKEKGIALLVVIPPDKSTIYARYMPNEIPVIGEKSQLDQLVEYMKLNGSMAILDLRQTLLAESQFHDVYYKTDTHWNDVGAYHGYVEILNALDDPRLVPYLISDFNYTYIGDSVRDLPPIMGIPDYQEESWALVPRFDVPLSTETSITVSDGRRIRIISNTDNRLPKLLVFHDSFYDALAHFLEPHFSKVTTIPFTFEKGIWSLDRIQQENPDIVVIEIVERYLDTSLPLLLEN